MTKNIKIAPKNNFPTKKIQKEEIQKINPNDNRNERKMKKLKAKM
jgi:hypothetical protein